METRIPNGPNYNLRLSELALSNLPKHERPLRIRMGEAANSAPQAPAQVGAVPAPSIHRIDSPQEQVAPEPAAATRLAGNNVYINVNIFFSKNMPELGLNKPIAEQNAVEQRRVVVPQQTAAINVESLRKSQEDDNTPLRIANRPSEHAKPPMPVPVEPNHIASLFDNSNNSEVEPYEMLRKRELVDVKCACHHLHVNDNVKISRFSYKSQLRKIRNKWADKSCDFPIIFKRKLARFEDDNMSVSINEIVDFSKKQIQPEAENDLLGMEM